MHTKVEIFWSEEDQAWVALDLLRPGCSAVGDSEADALRELNDARVAWDGAKASALRQGRPDFGIDTIHHEGIPLTCRYVAPGVTFSDLARAFHEAKAKAEPGDHYAGNPAKWPDNRGIAAVLDMLLDAIYGPDTPVSNGERG